MYALAELHSRRNKPFILHFHLYYIIVCVKIKIFFEKCGVVAVKEVKTLFFSHFGAVSARMNHGDAPLFAETEHLPAVQSLREGKRGRFFDLKSHLALIAARRNTFRGLRASFM